MATMASPGVNLLPGQKKNLVSADTMRRVIGAHIDAGGDPSHPLAMDPLTGFFQDAIANSSHLADKAALAKAVNDHIEAMDNQNHPYASHDMTTVFSHLRDALSGNSSYVSQNVVPQFAPEHFAGSQPSQQPASSFFMYLPGNDDVPSANGAASAPMARGSGASASLSNMGRALSMNQATRGKY